MVCGRYFQPSKQRSTSQAVLERGYGVSAALFHPERSPRIDKKKLMVSVDGKCCGRELRLERYCFGADGERYRLHVLASWLLAEHTPSTSYPRGLFAGQRIPAHTLIVYGGRGLSQHTLEALRRRYNLELSYAYLKGGDKDDHDRIMVFGQFVPFYNDEALNIVGQRANEAVGLGCRGNANFAMMPIDENFKQRYPWLMSKGGAAGQRSWPAIRTTRDIEAGEEILLITYGSGGRARMAIEQDPDLWNKTFPEVTLWKCRFIQPHAESAIETYSNPHSVTRDLRHRRPPKRFATDDNEGESDDASGLPPRKKPRRESGVLLSKETTPLCPSLCSTPFSANSPFLSSSSSPSSSTSFRCGSRQ